VTAGPFGATTAPNTTMAAHRPATRKPPRKASVEYSLVVAQSTPVPTIPASPTTLARRSNPTVLVRSRHRIRPVANAAPTKSPCALVSVP
jgi:hypothetical protein